MRRLLLLGAFGMLACSAEDSPIGPQQMLVDPPDTGPSQDMGPVADGGETMDTGVDAGAADQGVPDTGPEDTGPVQWDPEPGPPPMAFAHGVASGDPLVDRVILWTRVSPSASPAMVDVAYEVSDHPSFETLTTSGTFSTGPHRDYTVKVDAAGLAPGTTYWYRFEAEGVVSPVGRTKTLPAGPVAKARFAVVSCAHFGAGYFNIYRLIADQRRPDDDLDAVIHLGDYVYEYGLGQYAEDLTGRDVEPRHELLTLEDYRTRHAVYKRDLDSQAMHATHPMIAVWDDHEMANDAWKDGAQNHDEASEGLWSDRKASAVQAYYEWMPVRDPAMGGPLFRRFDYGELLTLHMTDTRVEGRDEQLDLLGILDDPIGGALALASGLLDEDRSLLGETQETWLEDGLLDSTTTWQIIGNQVMMGQLYAPVLPEIPDLPDSARNQVAIIRLLAQAADNVLSRVLPGPGLPIALDSWDGYIPARLRLFETLARVDDVIVITGDFHNAWALELARDRDLKDGTYLPETGAAAVATEFVTPSVTSPGFEGQIPGAALDIVRDAILDKNSHIKWTDLAQRGYFTLTVRSDKAEAQYYFSPNARVPSDARNIGPRFEVERGRSQLIGPL